MKRLHAFTKFEWAAIALVLSVLIGVAGSHIYSTSGGRAVIMVTSGSTICNINGNIHAGASSCPPKTYKIHNDGSYDGHTNLSVSEVKELKSYIAKTDFTKYIANPHPRCTNEESWQFPQKYDDKTFTPCKLIIPYDDENVNGIEGIEQSHELKG